MPTPYYRIELEKREVRTGGMATACLMECHLCGSTISSRGGGAPVLCDPCGDAVVSGRLRGSVKRD